MLGLAAVAGEETFLHPEIVLFASSSLQFLRNLSRGLDDAAAAVRARTGICVAAVLMGIHTVTNYSSDFISSLPPLGLMALTIAYSIGGEGTLKKIYRTLTTGGGLALTVGAASSGISAIEHDNGPSFVMSLAYFILNGYFTLSEVIQFCKVHGITLDIKALRKRAGLDRPPEQTTLPSTTTFNFEATACLPANDNATPTEITDVEQ